MAKLTRAGLSSLSKQDLIDYTGKLQSETGGSWNSSHLIAVLAAFLAGFLASRVLAQRSPGQLRPSPSGPAQATASAKLAATQLFKQWAKELGLDTKQFDECLDSGKHAQAVKADVEAGSKAGVNGTPAFFINGTPVKGALPFEEFKKVIDGALAGSTPGPTQVEIGALPAEGDDQAPVTIIEFSDYQCPFCGRFAQQTLPQIKKEYVSTGKVKWYFRDFPLSSIHPNAQKAAEAARCANDQKAFWKYHDQIYSNQNSLN